MPERIETKRLVLRKPRLDDASAIFHGWAQDKEVTRYLTWRPHQRIEQTQEFVRGCLAAWEHETRFPYMITLKEAGEVIGMIDPRIEGPKVGIGYGAARAHWGKGYITEATRTIIEWAFQQPSIYRVYATTDVENVASQRVLEKVGMQCEGVLRKYILHPNISAVPRDSYMYAIVKE
ncbi:MAG TPA: GNAT family N-acetyltransferase [Anaerolineales bacterium]|nr:GNAT family N-acetyltransferase [Anaerolineales bacterium]